MVKKNIDNNKKKKDEELKKEMDIFLLCLLTETNNSFEINKKNKTIIKKIS